MIDFETENNSGAESAASPEPQQSPSVDNTPAPSAQETSSPADRAAPQQTKESPFHEHPRFKELVEQKNTYQKQIADLSSKMESLMKERNSEAEARKAETQKDALIERLKGIDPEFAKRFEEIDGSRKELAELRQWRQSIETEQVNQQAYNTFNKLCADNKVPDNIKAYYESRIKDELQLAKSQGRAVSLSELPTYFKKVHEPFNQYIEDLKRNAGNQYVADKRQDAARPSVANKGAAVNPQKPVTYSKDRETALSQVTSRILELNRKSNKI